LSRRKAQRRKRPAPCHSIEITIESLGARGDGVARDGDGRPVHVPGALPGEKWRADIAEGKVQRAEMLQPSPLRRAPFCPHYQGCGGCQAQHLSGDFYGEWKRDMVRQALARAGLSAEVVEPLMRLQGDDARRRRVDWALLRDRAGQVKLGYRQQGSHHIVDIGECAIIEADIAALIAPLKVLATALLQPGERGRCRVTLADTGTDVLLTLPHLPDLEERERLTAFAVEQDCARLSVQLSEAEPETILLRRHPVVHFSGVTVPLPQNCFLQASRAADRVLCDLAVSASEEGGAGGEAADLFSGLGTFSFALRKAGARVHAYEADEAAVAAMQAGINRAQLGNIGVTRRDLFRQPLLAAELKRFSRVLFDPPRAGAREQVEMLAASDVAEVIAVSCNPASFARDMAILVQGGYRLERVVPVDQFPYSRHVEVVARLRRAD